MIQFTTTPSAPLSTEGASIYASLSFAVLSSPIPNIAATVDWGDGTTSSFSSTTGSLTVTGFAHVYASWGTFAWTVTATNDDLVRPEKAFYTGIASIPAPGFVSDASVDPAVSGPILPTSAANAADSSWNFDFGDDDACLRSSLYLLLTTSRGERVMAPDYGTDLRRLVFSLADEGLYDAIRADISQAVSRWEPRAQLDQIEIAKSGATINVNVSFKSLLSGTSLPLQVVVN